MEINEFNKDISQQFYIFDNNDGSYIIKTKITENNSAVEIKDGGTKSGNLVQQWSLNGEKWQNWIFEPVEKSGNLMNVFINKEKNQNLSVVKTEIYKEKDCVHTVVFVK